MKKSIREQRNREILKSYNLWRSYSEMAETFGLSKGGVHKIIRAILEGKAIPNIESEPEINVHSLRDIAIYLQGIKDGKGNLLPLGNVVLDNLWDAISILNKKGTEKNDFSAKDMVQYALYCLESKLGKDQVIANLKSYCKDNQIK